MKLRWFGGDASRQRALNAKVNHRDRLWAYIGTQENLPDGVPRPLYAVSTRRPRSFGGSWVIETYLNDWHYGNNGFWYGSINQPPAR